MFVKHCYGRVITLLFGWLVLLVAAGCHAAPTVTYQIPTTSPRPTASIPIDSQRPNVPPPSVEPTPEIQVTAPGTPFLQPTPNQMLTPSTAALSRDLLFVAEKDSHLAIYGVDRDGSNLTLWQDNFTRVTALSFSGSGSAIAILGARGSDPQSIYIARTDVPAGSFAVAVPMTVTSPLAWSPQGNMIAFSADNRQAESIYAVDLATKRLIPLIQEPSLLARNPRWSPDGQWIAFQSTKEPGCFDSCSSRIGLRNMQSGVVEEVTTHLYANPEAYVPRGECAVSWSPDSTEFVFQQDCVITEIPHRLHVFDLRTHKMRPLLPDLPDVLDTQSVIGDEGPHWLPNGVILFNSDRNGPIELLMVRPDGKDLRQAVKAPPFQHYYLDFSHDGIWITWTNENNDLWSGNTATGQITDLHVMACDVKFSPSAFLIAYTTWCFPHEGEYGLWTSDRTGKDAVNVAPSLKLPKLPAPWSWNPSKSK